MLSPRASDLAAVSRTPNEAEHDPSVDVTAASDEARATGIENVRCWLFEPDGALLSAGLIAVWNPDTACRVLVAGLDWPGQVIQRCLLGDVREVGLELEWGTRLPALVVRVWFDRNLGRTSELHLTSVCQESCVYDAVEDPDEVVQPGPR